MQYVHPRRLSSSFAPTCWETLQPRSRSAALGLIDRHALPNTAATVPCPPPRVLLPNPGCRVSRTPWASRAWPSRGPGCTSFNRTETGAYVACSCTTHCSSELWLVPSDGDWSFVVALLEALAKTGGSRTGSSCLLSQTSSLSLSLWVILHQFHDSCIISCLQCIEAMNDQVRRREARARDNVTV